MGQISFAEAEYKHKKKNIRREKFLEQMNKLISSWMLPSSSCFHQQKKPAPQEKFLCVTASLF